MAGWPQLHVTMLEVASEPAATVAQALQTQWPTCIHARMCINVYVHILVAIHVCVACCMMYAYSMCIPYDGSNKTYNLASIPSQKKGQLQVPIKLTPAAQLLPDPCFTIAYCTARSTARAGSWLADNCYRPAQPS